MISTRNCILSRKQSVGNWPFDCIIFWTVAICMAFVSWINDINWLIGIDKIKRKQRILYSIDRGVFFRFYWICILIASFIGMILIFVYTIDAYANDAISINFDTAYLNWNNIFPAISFCMLRSADPKAEWHITHFIRSYYKEHNIEEPIE